MQQLVRFAHLHAVFDESDPFTKEGVALAHLARVDSLTSVVVDGVRTGGAQVRIVHDKVVHLGVELIEPIQP